MLKKWISLAALTLLAAGFAQAKKMEGDDLSNMIIQGENRLRMTPRAPTFEWTVDPYREVASQLEASALLSGLKTPVVERPPLLFAPKSQSPLGASPWLNGIHEGPVITLHFKVGEKAEPQQWTFLIKDSMGGVFYELKKRAVLPAELAWDGFGKKGPLHAGEDYTYSFSAVDKAGNPQRLGGDAFRIAAFRYQRGRTITTLEPEAVFDGRTSSRLSSKGNNLLTEVKDALRHKFGERVDVVVFDNDAKFALTRAQVIREFMVKNANWPEGAIRAEARPLKDGEGYKHVEISIK